MFKEFSNPLLFGIDGPYYYIQVSSILNHGYIKYPDPPLAFYILTFFALLTHDIILGIKVGSVFIMLLTLYVIYFLVKQIGGEISGYSASLFYVFSPYLARLNVDFLKNSMGLLFLMLTIFYYYKSTKEKNWKYSFLSSIFLVLTGLTHILDFGTAFLVIIILCLFSCRIRKELKLLVLPPLTGLLLIILGIIYEPAMGGDVSRFNLLVNDILYGKIGGFNILNLSTILFPLVIGFIGLILSKRLSNDMDRALLLTFSIVLIIYNIPLYPQSHFYRLNLMTSILASPILGLIVAYLKDLKYNIMIILLISSFLIPEFTHQLLMMRPSIPAGEYHEIGHLINTLPNDTVYIVPDVRLKYWVETYEVDAYKSPSEAPAYPFKVLIIDKTSILQNNPHPRVFKPPPYAKLIYDGKYLQAYRL
jgi:hypothetical protein